MANVVLPKVRMFLPCAGIDLAPGTPCIIYSPLHAIRMPTGVTSKYLADEINFYVVLTDGVGAFRLSVELFSDEETVLKRSHAVMCQFKGGMQLAVQEIAMSMTEVPFDRPGVYEFRLVANHAYLDERGTALLIVLPG